MQKFVSLIFSGSALIALLFWASPAAFSESSLRDNLSSALTVQENQTQYDKYFNLADYYLGKYEFVKSLKACELALKFKPEDSLVHALMCLNYYEIAEQLNVKISEEKALKKRTYDQMAKIAEAGIKHAPHRGECYFMRGLAHARLSTTNGIIYSLFMAKGIEQDWLKSLQYPCEYTTPNGENLFASSHLALGSYYRLCPAFFLLTLIFGISGDLDKSVDYCKKAFQLDPTRIEIAKEYGISLITRGLNKKDDNDIEKGRELLNMVFSLPYRLKTDPVDVAHSKMLLNDISLCPGYSRDQQQDISEDSYLNNQPLSGQIPEEDAVPEKEL
jgi:tetratricopeptide (TPR) repeat protein